MKRATPFTIVLGVACSSLLAAPLCAQSEGKPAEGNRRDKPADPGLAAVEADLVARVHHTNQMEIDMGQLAKEKGSAKKVRKYGERLMLDHRMADKEIQDFARRHNLALTEPTPRTPEEGMEMAKEMAATERLKQLTGAEFDHAFLEEMARGHEKAIALLTDACEKKLPEKSELRSRLQRLIPILKQHHALALHLEGVREPRHATSNGSAKTTGK